MVEISLSSLFPHHLLLFNYLFPLPPSLPPLTPSHSHPSSLSPLPTPPSSSPLPSDDADGIISRIEYEEEVLTKDGGEEVISRVEYEEEVLGRVEYDVYMPGMGVAVEYQGEHHYNDIPSAYHPSEVHQYRDHIKRSIAHRFSIRLIAIPYWSSLSPSSLLSFFSPFLPSS